jgi:hypothetical protein
VGGSGGLLGGGDGGGGPGGPGGEKGAEGGGLVLGELEHEVYVAVVVVLDGGAEDGLVEGGALLPVLDAHLGGSDGCEHLERGDYENSNKW